MAKRTRKPYAGLPAPPPGTYDPSIDASWWAAKRGYGDLQRDTRTQNTRAASDFAIGLEDIKRQRDYGLADILQNRTRTGEDIARQGGQLEQDYQRGLADILSARTRGTEDYNTRLTDIHRGYRQLGNRQLQATAAAGLGGGALAQAAQKRRLNESIDRQPVDTTYNRFIADSQQQETRLGQNHDQAVSLLDQQRQRAIEDLNTSQQRLTAQYGTGQSSYQGGNAWADAWLRNPANAGKVLPGTLDTGYAGQQLSLGYQRGVQDRATQIQRAGRELNAYQQDLVPTRYYSAAGLTPYTPPRKRRR